MPMGQRQRSTNDVAKSLLQLAINRKTTNANLLVVLIVQVAKIGPNEFHRFAQRLSAGCRTLQAAGLFEIGASLISWVRVFRFRGELYPAPRTCRLLAVVIDVRC